MSYLHCHACNMVCSEHVANLTSVGCCTATSVRMHLRIAHLPSLLQASGEAGSARWRCLLWLKSSTSSCSISRTMSGNIERLLRERSRCMSLAAQEPSDCGRYSSWHSVTIRVRRRLPAASFERCCAMPCVSARANNCNDGKRWSIFKTGRTAAAVSAFNRRAVSPKQPAASHNGGTSDETVKLLRHGGNAGSCSSSVWSEATCTMSSP